MSENLIKTDENGVRHCTQCPNQCPESALKCGRGRKLFGAEEGGSEEGRGEGHAHEHGHEHGHGHDHHGHDHGGDHEKKADR
ncbi:MAG: hypothetical protein LKH04_07895 [Lachnospiraceae bacterium]|nr:hypothetical protein [Lachnospiraceae bacterium]MCI1398913.1 hypothetical protein [Lachnospiraceae bacterium]MCI1424200.1 hypothetical protein [Lachnospiraceae bacterium]MCI1453004.1 hypothetical protein [Lachnospiraceae bacterium]MDD5850331.1 hypothetical protein [Bacillota bacterium]